MVTATRVAAAAVVTAAAQVTAAAVHMPAGAAQREEAATRRASTPSGTSHGSAAATSTRSAARRRTLRAAGERRRTRIDRAAGRGQARTRSAREGCLLASVRRRRYARRSRRPQATVVYRHRTPCLPEELPNRLQRPGVHHHVANRRGQRLQYHRRRTHCSRSHRQQRSRNPLIGFLRKMLGSLRLRSVVHRRQPPSGRVRSPALQLAVC